MTIARNVSIVRIAWMLSVPAVQAVRNAPTSVPNAVNTAKTVQTAISVLNAEPVTAVQAVRAAFAMNVHSVKCARTTSAYAEAVVPDVRSSVRNAEKSAKTVPMTGSAEGAVSVPPVRERTVSTASCAKTALAGSATAAKAVRNAVSVVMNATKYALNVIPMSCVRAASPASTAAAAREITVRSAGSANYALIMCAPAATAVLNVYSSARNVRANAKTAPTAASAGTAEFAWTVSAGMETSV